MLAEISLTPSLWHPSLRFGFGSGKEKSVSADPWRVGTAEPKAVHQGLALWAGSCPGAALVPWLQDCNPIITGLRHLTDYRNSYSAPDTIAWRVVSRALAPRIP